MRTTSPLWGDPGRRSDPIGQHLVYTPDMICQTTGHSGSDKDFSFARLRFGQPSAQFMMRPAKVVGAAHQPHPGFEHAHAARRVSAPPCQAGETLSHRPIEAFDK